MIGRFAPEVLVQVARLYVEEAEAVFKVTRRAVYDDREAEDLVQEAFQAAALAWEKIAGYSPERKRAWLRRVAINKAIDRYRAGSRMHLVADVHVARLAPSAEEVVVTRLERDRCLQVIREMPPVRRLIAYLRWHEEWTVREIAEDFGIATSTVRVHLHDARVTLEEALGVFCADVPDADDGPGREEAR
jgi:RNA polymerase sigma factor (sigma-70 family)